jgi:hypothetical protein
MFSAFKTFEDPSFPSGEQHYGFRTQKKCTLNAKLFVVSLQQVVFRQPREGAQKFATPGEDSGSSLSRPQFKR